MSNSNNLRQSILSIFSGRVILIFITAIYFPVLSRLIGQQNFGEFSAFLAIYTIVTLFGNFGIIDSIRKNIAEYNNHSKEQSQILVSGLVLSISQAAIVSLVVSIFYVVDIYNPYGFLVVVLSLCILPENLIKIARGAYYGQRKEHLSERISVLRRLLFTLFGLAAAVYYGNVISIFWGYLFAAILTSMIGMYVVMSDFSLRGYKIINSTKLWGQRLFSYARWQALGGISAALLYNTDVILVSYFLDYSRTGIYKSVLISAEFVWFIPSIIQIALLQNISNLHSNNRGLEIEKNSAMSIKYTIMTLTLFGGGLFFLAGDFLELYFGPAYREGAQALQILIIGAYLFGLARAFIPILQAIGRIKKTETVTVICLLINILLNIYLIPVYGINGAAIATGISYGLMIFGVLYLWRNTPYTLMNDLNIIKLGSGSFIFIISYGTISYYVRLSPLLSIIVLSLIGLVIFIIIFTLNGEIPYRKYKIY